MKGKLIKTGNDYILYSENKETLAISNGKIPGRCLSLTNCQVIEDGYDLVDLVSEFAYNQSSEDSQELFAKFAFIDGFQKAMELMDGKKFSKYDMLDFAEFFMNLTDKSKPFQKLKDWESLQPKEWEVEIEMICPHPMDTYVCGMQYGCDEDGCNHPNQIPYLDKNGCLILKRI